MHKKKSTPLVVAQRKAFVLNLSLGTEEAFALGLGLGGGGGGRRRLLLLPAKKRSDKSNKVLFVSKDCTLIRDFI